MAVDEQVQPDSFANTQNLKPPRGSASVHLDALRGLAAFSVVVSHWRDNFFLEYAQQPHHNPWMAALYYYASFGRQWVIVFFVMSGFLVGSSVLRSKENGRWSCRSYLLARLTRLYIVLLPALALGGLTDWFGMHLPFAEPIYSGHAGVHSLTWSVNSRLNPIAFLGNVLFLQDIRIPILGYEVTIFGSNGPLWSLNHEFWYYVAFPVILAILWKGQPWWKRVILSLFLIAGGWVVGRYILVLFIPWLMGVLIPYLPPFPSRRKWILTLAAIFAWVVVIAAMFVSIGDIVPAQHPHIPTVQLRIGRSWLFPINDLILGLAVSLLMWVLLNSKSQLSSAYVWIARRAAHSSYTLYLIHMPMLVFFKALMQWPRAVPDTRSVLIALIPLVIILLYAQLVYELFEKNTDAVRNWIKPYVMGRKEPPSRIPEVKLARE